MRVSFIYLVFTLLDAVTTLIIVGEHGGYELNPIWRAVLPSPPLFFALRILAGSIVLLFIAQYRNILIGTTVLLGLIVSFHTISIVLINL